MKEDEGVAGSTYTLTHLIRFRLIKRGLIQSRNGQEVSVRREPSSRGNEFKFQLPAPPLHFCQGRHGTINQGIINIAFSFLLIQGTVKYALVSWYAVSMVSTSFTAISGYEIVRRCLFKSRVNVKNLSFLSPNQRSYSRTRVLVMCYLVVVGR